MTLSCAAETSSGSAASPSVPPPRLEVLSCQPVAGGGMDLQVGVSGTSGLALANAATIPAPVSGGGTRDGIFSARFDEVSTVTFATAEFVLPATFSMPFEAGAAGASSGGTVQVEEIGSEASSFLMSTTLEGSLSAFRPIGAEEIEVVRGDETIPGDSTKAVSRGSEIVQFVTLSQPALGDGWTVEVARVRFEADDMAVVVTGCGG